MVKKRPTESFELEYPIEVDGVEVSTLTVRRPTVRDQLNMERRKGTEAEKGIGYFAALCEMAPSDIEAMDASDFARLGEVIQGFQPTPKES